MAGGRGYLGWALRSAEGFSVRKRGKREGGIEAGGLGTHPSLLVPCLTPLHPQQLSLPVQVRVGQAEGSEVGQKGAAWI